MNDKIVRVSDILEQIDELNKMIEIHSIDPEGNSMLTQYQYMKNKFVSELDSILQEFQLTVKAA